MTIEDLRRVYRIPEAPEDLARIAVERFVAANSARTVAGWHTPAWAAAAVFAVAVVLLVAQDGHDTPRAPSMWSLSHLQSPARLQGDLRLPTLGTLRIASVSAGRSLLASARAESGRALPTVRPPTNPITPTIPEEKAP